jgi:APA family basic amino acid/polyamine antiporter
MSNKLPEFPHTEPVRTIGLFDAINLVIGGIIGSGIFLVPAEIARDLPVRWMILSVWAFTGLVSFFGALAYAELGAMLPASGGQYVYLREAYGPLIAFLFGWTSFLVIQTGTIAALAVGFAIYLGHFVPLAGWAQTSVAMGLIAFLTALNVFGVREGVWFQTLCTILRVAGILLLIGAALVCPAHAASRRTAPFTPVSASAVAAAMAACFWTYEGWYCLGFIAGEIKRPRRNIAIAQATGMACVVSLYLLANVAYLHVLTIPQIASTERVAAAVAESTMGRFGAAVIALTILISMGGSNNAGVLTAPRLYFAQARDGLFFQAVGRLHPRWKTPVFALLLQAIWSAALALTGSFELLYSYVIFASWLFYCLAVGGVIVLRRRHPEWERPYRMWGYPVTPLAFALFAFSFLIVTFLNDARPSLIGAGIVAAGIPAYMVWNSRRDAKVHRA